ncbi:MAG: histidine phosphatase family protein [Solirubrobacterales bacterium]|nr:histidine phosphatase family protein [Solirubrobacterales bacterium]
MSQQLWFLRHGEAVPHDAKRDVDRELTARGERQSIAAGEALARLGLEFAAAYTSPKVRARDTARLACRSLDLEPGEVHGLATGFDAEAALELLLGSDGDARVLLVGHEPDFSRVVHTLTGARVDFKKGGVAAVRIDRGSGTLIALLRPRELESMGLDAAAEALDG